MEHRTGEPPRTTDADVIPADECARRLRAILGPSTSGDLPRRRRDQWILLHEIALAFAHHERLSEKEATARIQDFLLGPGAKLRLDAVTLRRALVDDGFVDRDPAGRDYRASTRHERFVRFESAPEHEGRDLTQPS